MTTTMRIRRQFATSVSAGTDDVIAGVFMPSDTVIGNIRGRVSLHSQILAVNNVVHAAVEGWILPVSDPDAATTMSALWDALVPKDTSVNALDLDTGAADATPFYEGGTILWEKVFDVGASPRRVFHMHDDFSLGHNNVVSQQDVESAFLQEWFAGKDFMINVPRTFRVTVPSLFVVGVASPVADRTSATTPIAGLAETDWAQIKYIDHVMERAVLDLLGVIEAGAETPWEEATALLRQHIDPLMLEADAGTFLGATWFTSGEIVADHTVPGIMAKSLITGGR